MKDARFNTEKYEGQQLFVYLPDREDENLLVVEEGTGDNLLYSDRENGYTGYIEYYSLTMSMSAECPETPDARIKHIDGGEVLLKKHPRNLTIGQIVHALLEDCLYPHDAVLLKGSAA